MAMGNGDGWYWPVGITQRIVNVTNKGGQPVHQPVAGEELSDTKIVNNPLEIKFRLDGCFHFPPSRVDLPARAGRLSFASLRRNTVRSQTWPDKRLSIKLTSITPRKGTRYLMGLAMCSTYPMGARRTATSTLSAHDWSREFMTMKVVVPMLCPTYWIFSFPVCSMT